MKIFSAFVLSFFVLTMAACGFHLKGEASLPLELKYLQLSPSEDKEFNDELIKQLKQAGAKMGAHSKASSLRVRFETLPEMTVAKSSSTGLQIQQLKIRVEYSLKNNSDLWLVEQKTLTQSREFELDTAQLLAKNREKQQLYQEMKRSLVRILLYQLQLFN